MKGRRRDTGFAGMEPGDYYGPVVEGDGKPRVYFLLPNARDEGVLPHEKAVGSVTAPPHGIVEEDDGTITIEGSIQSVGSDGVRGWHGYLRHGEWSEA